MKTIHLYEGPDRAGKSTAISETGLFLQPFSPLRKAAAFYRPGLQAGEDRINEATSLSEFAEAVHSEHNEVCLDRGFISAMVFAAVRSKSPIGYDWFMDWAKQLEAISNSYGGQVTLVLHKFNVSIEQTVARGADEDSFEVNSYYAIQERYLEAYKRFDELVNPSRPRSIDYKTIAHY